MRCGGFSLRTYSLALAGAVQCKIFFFTIEFTLMKFLILQITVSKDDLPELLKAAHWLGVKGLESTYDYFNDSLNESSDSITLDQGTSRCAPSFWREIMVAINDPDIQGKLKNMISSVQNKCSNVDDECGDDKQIIHQPSLESGTTKDASVSTKDINVNDILKVDVPSQGSGVNATSSATKDIALTGSVPCNYNEDDPTSEGRSSDTDSTPVKSPVVSIPRLEFCTG